MPEPTVGDSSNAFPVPTEGKTPATMELLACRAWNELVAVAGRKETIRYSVLAKGVGYAAPGIGKVLESIQDYCQEKGLPSLTILAHDKDGNRGSGFTQWNHDEPDGGVSRVWAFNWSEWSNPFEIFAEGETIDSIAEKVVRGSKGLDEVCVLIKSRGIAQQIFREALLREYQGSCAFSGYKGDCLLEAAHIVPWSKCQNKRDRIDPRNGLLLATHFHRMFDVGWIRVTKDGVIEIHEALIERSALPKKQMDEMMALDGRQLRPPKNAWNGPSLEFLQSRYDMRVG